MKKIFVAFLLVLSSLAHADSVKVLEAELPLLDSARSYVTTAFQMDQRTGEGYAKVSVSKSIGYTGQPGDYYPGIPGYYTQVVFRDTVRVEGLSLVAGKIVYQGQNGDVVCGNMGTSRVFRNPTVYLNGNCSLVGKVVRENGEYKVLVDFVTK